MNLLIINGPNLNLLGKRQPEIYGTKTFEQYLGELKNSFQKCTLTYFQSNVEGELINALHKTNADGILINAGGYTHTSVALSDAIASIDKPVIEIHISNIAAREPFRHTSLIAKNCVGSIHGFGLKSYDLGIQWFINHKELE